MTMLLAQIFLLMLAAFLLGAILGCLFRHAIFGRAVDLPAGPAVRARTLPPVAPAPQPVAAAAKSESSVRFERALTGAPSRPVTPPPASRPAVPVVEVQPPPPAPKPQSAPSSPAPSVPTVAAPAAQPAPSAPKPQATPSASVVAAPPFAQPAPVAPKPVVQTPPAPAPAAPVAAPAAAAPPSPQSVSAASMASAAAAAAAVAASAVATQARAPEAKPATPAAPPAEPPKASVAAPQAPAPAPAPETPPFGTVVRPLADVKDMTPAPAVPAAPEPAPVAPVAAAPIVAEPPKPAAPVAPADDLTRIRLIDAATQARLNALGVRRFDQIASWTPGDVNRFTQVLGYSGRIEQQNWIEQAQILTRGGETDYSRRKARGEFDAPAPSTPPAPAPAVAAVAPAVVSAPPVPVAAPAAKPGADATAVASRVAAQAAGPDRLHRIIGINAEAEKILNQNGITRFSEIAAWTAADAEKFDRLLGGRAGRIAEENWIEQARILALGGDAEGTRPVKLADAIRENATKPQPDALRSTSRPDLSGLRSVRSEALRGDATGVAQRPIGSLDDLKRIRGIGVLIEKKLNSLGVTGYEQVANWTGVDIDRISQILDFKGRIERENWVEQARILASGGQTEFSRRVDRGEVESSR